MCWDRSKSKYNFYDFCLCVDPRYFSIPTNELPLLVQDHIKENRDSVRKNYSKKCDQNDNKKNSPKRVDTDATRYYQLKSGPSPQFITFVDGHDAFHEMLNYLLRQQIVAFDAEWNPIKTSSPELALLQFATIDRIFLIDVISTDISRNDWNQLAANVFNNLEILKIGNETCSLFTYSFPALSTTLSYLSK